MNRELLKKALEAIKFNDEWHTKHDEHNGYFDSTIHDVNYSAIKAIEAELAKPEDSGMTVLDIQDDDALRFIQRVLESDAPEADRTAARDKIVEIRTRVRELAKPEAEPYMWIIEDNAGLSISKWKFTENAIALYTSPRPMQRLTSEEISDLIDEHWEGDNEAHFINAIMDAMIEKNK
jgi:pyruvate formate-lyase activating enzyme-like uncharacterized protein